MTDDARPDIHSRPAPKRDDPSSLPTAPASSPVVYEPHRVGFATWLVPLTGGAAGYAAFAVSRVLGLGYASLVVGVVVGTLAGTAHFIWLFRGRPRATHGEGGRGNG